MHYPLNFLCKCGTISFAIQPNFQKKNAFSEFFSNLSPRKRLFKYSVCWIFGLIWFSFIENTVSSEFVKDIFVSFLAKIKLAQILQGNENLFFLRKNKINLYQGQTVSGE
jgi:hypothetical protein